MMKKFIFILAGMGCLTLTAQPPSAPPTSGAVPVACSIPGWAFAENSDPETLLAAYNAQVHQIRSLYVVAFVRGRSGREYGIGDEKREIPAIINFERPDLIRVTGVLPFVSSRGFEMASDGHEFRLLVPEDGKKVFLVGPVDAPANSPKPRENLRPQPFMDAIRWQEGSMRAVPQTQKAFGESARTLEVDLPPSHNEAVHAKVDFDLLHGVVSSLATYDSVGHLLYRAQYADWQRVERSPQESSEGCFPRTIRFEQPKQNYELELRIREVFLNPKIPMNDFRPSPPRGTPVVHIDLSGTGSH
jgi:hypothetical protein